MGSNFYSRALRGIPLSVPTGYTHAPGLGGMPTGCSRYLPPWPLCMVCAKTRVINLLNHTPPTVGTSGSTTQVWGLPEQDSIYGRLRRLMSFLHDMSNKIISTNKSTLIIPCKAIPDITVPTETDDKPTPTQGRGFPGFLTGMLVRHMRMITNTCMFIS